MKKQCFLALSSCLLFSLSLGGDEGMWPFNMLPKEKIQELYNFNLSSEWVEHLQKSCLRISYGGSASFVSPNGLVMTNHHVGTKAIYDLSASDSNFMEKGFYAESLEKELKCANVYVDQLISIRDCTEEVNKAFTSEMSASAKEELRKTRITEIKDKAQKETGLQPEMVTLYHGGKYQLYLYKRYTDIRLVMAPEAQIAYFGGDEDNFEYPRYALDMCFFRVYENGKPLSSPDYLKWSPSGPTANEALFVAGNPGQTQRLDTADHLRFVKNTYLPLILNYIEERLAALKAFSLINEENKRIADQDYFRLSNAYKALNGIAIGLNDPAVIETKEKRDEALYGSTASPQYKAWENLKIAFSNAQTFWPTYFMLEGSGSRYCKLYSYAKALVRSAEEKAKPNEKRLKEYTDTELATLEMSLFSNEPIYLNLEKVLLTSSLQKMEKLLGKDNPSVKIALAGKTPEVRADELLSKTKLSDVSYRKELYNNPQVLQKSTDPLILLAKALDPSARAIRTKEENELESVEKESYAEIAAIRFEKYGSSVYPDATFTLRLSTGVMQGYEQNEKTIPSMTHFAGLYEKAKEYRFQYPYNLPQRWQVGEKNINLSTPFNFVLTNDIIGGNSGSPIVNSRGEVVGLIFDGNMQSLIWDYEFTEVQGRAVGVHSQAIVESLQKIYKATRLISELQPVAPKI